MTVRTARPKMGTIALYVDSGRERARAAAAVAAGVIQEAGFSIAFLEERHEKLGGGIDGVAIERAVLLVTIGGDGTLLRAAQLAAPHGVPLFGINTGRLGFLTEVDSGPHEATQLRELLRDGFCIDERIGLQAEVLGRSYFALNDIVIRRTGTSHMMPFRLFVDDRETAHVPADGIVVATPTGSTAYSLSAGGPILWPDVPAICIIALLPHTLFTRPIVVPNTSTIALSSDAGAHVALESDGRLVEELQPTDRVIVRRYPLPVRFARREPLNFPRLLEDKLRWNAPIKDQSS